MSVDPRLSKAFKEQNGFSLEGHLILLSYVGSHSHGTHIPQSEKDSIDDTDFMGIVIPPPDRLLGLHEWEGWNWQFEELDVVLYSLPKAVRLLLKGNPNILGLLWMRTEDYVFLDPVGRELIRKRDWFSSREVYNSFIGYAHGQFDRMTTFSAERALEYDNLALAIRTFSNGETTATDIIGADASKLAELAMGNSLMIDVFKKFQTLHRKYFSGYMGEKRKGMVRKFGYDTKNAAHLIRLLRMGTEFMQTGELKVFRSEDAQELIDIKKGNWSLEQVKETAEKGFALAHDAKEATTLPDHPNEAAAEEWLVSTLVDSCYIGWRNK